MENRKIAKLFKKNPQTLKTIFHELAEAGAIPVLYRFRDYIQGPIAPFLQEKDKNGDLCIHLAVKANRGAKAIQILTVLAELGADLNAANDDTRFTVVHLAVMGSDCKLLQWLAAQPHIDLNAKSWNGLTACEMAFIEMNERMMDILISHGAESPRAEVVHEWTAVFPTIHEE
ncbi:viral ankyrin 2 [Diadegma fenestrale ichnovirus]|uniref:Vankyrin_2.A3 n=1 Tax=Diadegma fenestrale ichnovirus TaxID=1428464 RepID=A0A075VNV3_9VIRU|nr:vankyrin_2.A3 [Diadegma fenestrale ichnovirus]ULM71625.1 viral ankyrin 2 [Diadegma fenestrale ichnovirus]